MRSGWIRVLPLPSPAPPEFVLALDLGEAEALSPAVQMKAALVLVDESAARRKAAQLGVPFTGALGILRWARQTGRISSLQTEVHRLRNEAHFFISSALEKALLISVGE